MSQGYVRDALLVASVKTGFTEKEFYDEYGGAEITDNIEGALLYSAWVFNKNILVAVSQTETYDYGNSCSLYTTISKIRSLNET